MTHKPKVVSISFSSSLGHTHYSLTTMLVLLSFSEMLVSLSLTLTLVSLSFPLVLVLLSLMPTLVSLSPCDMTESSYDFSTDRIYIVSKTDWSTQTVHLNFSKPRSIVKIGEQRNWIIVLARRKLAIFQYGNIHIMEYTCIQYICTYI